MSKLCIGIIFGGKSAEHEISLQSAKNIINAIDKNRFDIVLLYIDKLGKWYVNETNVFSNNIGNSINTDFGFAKVNISNLQKENKNHLINIQSILAFARIDVVFPIVHGTFGEDGSLQGMLKMYNLPFVGTGVLGSATCMDKDISKRLLRDAGLKVTPFVTLNRAKYNKHNFISLSSCLGLPLFIKPANQGSSVGVSKVNNETEFINALHLAFKFDCKVVVESNIKGREIECAILGNNAPKASICGEIIVKNEFYSYEDKYVNSNAAQLIVPAELELEIHNRIRKISIAAYQILGCRGMARVDIFLTPSNEIIINEINTLPGFTDISMYPRLWQSSGLSYQELISKLIELALEEHIATTY